MSEELSIELQLYLGDLLEQCELPNHARGDGLGFRSQHFD